MASSDYKKFNREIKAYVEMNSKIKNMNYCTSMSIKEGNNDIVPITKGNPFVKGHVVNSSLKKNNWTILRNNYTKLDGSYNLFNTRWKPYGFISQKKVSELTDNAIITLEFTSSLDGITLSFQENPLKNAEINIYNSAGLIKKLNIENNSKEVIYIDLMNYEFNKITIKVTEWADNNLPIWINSIVLGYAYLYEDNELIEFTVTEEVDKLVEETPTNEFSLTIGDYDKKYDPLNPMGITKLLNEDDTTFIPHIGIVEDNGRISYTRLGTFYFNRINYNENEVNITAYNLMEKLNKNKITNVNNSLNPLNEERYQPIILKGEIASYLTNYIMQNLDRSSAVTIVNKIRMVNNEFKSVSFTNFLQNASIIDGIFYINRNEMITIRPIDKKIVDSITKKELLSDIKYKNIKKIDRLDLEQNQTSIKDEGTQNTTSNFEATFIMKEKEETFCITSEDITNMYGFEDSNLTVTGAISYNIICPSELGMNVNDYMLFVKVKGNIGDEIKISGKYPTVRSSTYNRIVNKYGNGNNPIEMSNPFYDFYLNKDYDDITFSNFFDKTYSYEVDLDYNGNPTIEAGDYIEVESNYGIVPIFVQKHTLKYNGGLSGSIEGVE